MITLRCTLATTTILLVTIHWVMADDRGTHIKIRGIYGGVPTELLKHGELADYGVNAIFMLSGGVNAERISLLKKRGAQVFAEFNTMHVAG